MALNKEKVMDSARKFAEKGQIDKAIKEYLRLVEEDPTDVRVWLKVGDLYGKRGSKAEAIEAYERSARIYEGQGFFLKAVAVYKQILKLDPALIKINRRLGDLYVQLEMNSDAMQHYEAVSTQLLRDGRGQEALEVAKVVVELAPEDIAARIKLAEQYSKENFVPDAVREFTTACDQLRKQNRTDDFIKVAERLLWHRPEMFDLHRELAVLYMRRKDLRRALTKLQVCFKADNSDVAVLNLMVEAFAESDQAPKAVQVLKELARIHEAKNERELADAAHRRVLQLDPNDAEAQAVVGARRSSAVRPPAPNRAVLLTPQPERSRLNRTGAEPLTKDSRLVPAASAAPEFALPEYDTDAKPARHTRANSVVVEPRAESASETHADQISKLLSETDVYIKYKLFPKALEHLRRVFSLDPENVEGHERLKDVYLATGREDDALAELLKLAEIFAPTDPERAEVYLRELTSIDVGYQAAHDLARRYRLDLAEIPEVELSADGELEFDPDDLQTGAVDPESDDVGFEEVYSADIGEVNEQDIIENHRAPTMIAGLRGAQGHHTPAKAQPHRAVISPAELESRIDQHLSEETDLGFEASDFDEVPFDRAAAKAFDAEMTVDGATKMVAAHHDEPTSTSPTVMASPVNAASLEDELEEAEFYESQGLLEEARDILQRVAARYPKHPLVRAKLEELGIDAGGWGSVQGSPAPQRPPMAPASAAPVMAGRGPVPSFPGGGRAETTTTKASGVGVPGEFTKPTVMLQKPIEDHDQDTQYDLGLAYKEMGLYDDAIASFQKVLATDYRVGECILMVGMCLRLQGQHRRAIDQLSRGLRESGISSDEQVSLQYELAVTYQELGEAETAEALFAELEAQMPSFADVAVRRAQLRGELPAQGGKRAATSTDDAEEALNNIFSDE